MSEVPSKGLPELVIVTGAGRGIGRAIALDVATGGSHVICMSRSKTCEETAADIRAAGGSSEPFTIDLANYTGIGPEITDRIERFPYRRIGLILAAGSLGPSGSLATTALAEWDVTFRVNVLGNLAVAQAVLPWQTAARFGRILFFAGGGAAYAYPLFPAYAAAKAALVRAVENMHEDLKSTGDLSVAILAPGAVETDILMSVRAKGGYVRTTVGIEEPVAFARAFLSARHCGFSGCFVHVRDNWRPLLDGGSKLTRPDLWKLRRSE